jgi:Flp pilus assembly protein TadG
MMNLRKLYRSDSGASLVEFAILLPVMVFLLMGVIEIGRYTYYAVLAANAARAGAQYGSQNTTTADDITGMKNAATADEGSVPQFSPSPTPLCSTNEGATLGNCASSGSSGPAAGTIYYVQVVVTGTFTTLFHYPGIPNNIPITGSATMRVENQ